MPTYGSCYNSTGSRCSGRAQPGTLALREGVRASFPGIGDLGIYNCRPTRGGGSLSTHGEGRGWDAACNATTASGRALGDRLAAHLVSVAHLLGIQRIIWNRRQWDGKSQAWRAYSGVSPHTDHLHIELCWSAARDNPLTVEYVIQVLGGTSEEDELTNEEKEQLAAVYKALYTKRQDVAYEHLNILENKLDALAKKAGISFNPDGTVK